MSLVPVYWLPLFNIAAFWFVGVVSPGPNFFMILSTSLGRGCFKAWLSVLGVVSGTFLWASCGFLGLNVLFTIAPWLYLFIRISGAVYLIYLGIRYLRAKPASKGEPTPSRDNHSSFYYYRRGVLTSLSNPKTALFISSLFATVMPSHKSLSYGLLSIFVMLSISFLWYSLIALVGTSRRFVPHLKSGRINLNKLIGLIFCGYGLKFLLTGHSKD